MITGAGPPDTMVSLALPLPPEASAAALVTLPDVLATATGVTFGVAGPSTYCCQLGFVGQGSESAAAAWPPLTIVAASATTASAASLRSDGDSPAGLSSVHVAHCAPRSYTALRRFNPPAQTDSVKRPRQGVARRKAGRKAAAVVPAETYKGQFVDSQSNSIARSGAQLHRGSIEEIPCLKCLVSATSLSRARDSHHRQPQDGRCLCWPRWSCATTPLCRPSTSASMASGSTYTFGSAAWRALAPAFVHPTARRLPRRLSTVRR